MINSILPSFFVPFVGLIFPLIILGSFIVFIEKDFIN